MATPDDRAVVVDTNVLLSATAPLRPHHSAASRVLNEWPKRGFALVASGQVFREYLVVCTRPVEANGLGLLNADALANVAALRGRMRFLEEGEASWERLQTLVETYGCMGKQIHDANLVATALAAGVKRLVTANIGDFVRFAEEIEIIDLAAAAGE